jgi:hypothetical protein
MSPMGWVTYVFVSLSCVGMIMYPRSAVVTKYVYGIFLVLVQVALYLELVNG